MSVRKVTGEEPQSNYNYGQRGNHTHSAQPEDFEDAYQLITPAWEIGRPQRAFINLAMMGKIKGRVLDMGCGTGEHVLMAAVLGLDAVGVDTSPTAIRIAEGKAHKRGLRTTFLVSDVLLTDELDAEFDTVLDCGMFHNLADENRTVFADRIHAVLRPGGWYIMLCFSDQRPRSGAARTISQEEIHRTFSNGFRIDSIESALMEENASSDIPAWLARIIRI